MSNKGKAMIRYQKRKPDILPDLPKNRPIFWLATDVAGDDILPCVNDACFKLSCTRIVLDRATIVCNYPHHQHYFVTVRGIRPFRSALAA